MHMESILLPEGVTHRDYDECTAYDCEGPALVAYFHGPQVGGLWDYEHQRWWPLYREIDPETFFKRAFQDAYHLGLVSASWFRALFPVAPEAN